MNSFLKNGALLLATASLLTSFTSAETTDARTRESLDTNWKFARFGVMPDGSHLDEPGSKNGAAATPSSDQFNDATWRTLNVPHDWGVENPFQQDLPGWTGKLPWAGIGWYRKSLTFPKSDLGKRIFIDFDGAMSDSTIYLNGKKVGGWPYGYSSFRVELTDAIKFGQSNQLAVRLDNKQSSSRWYPGAGIYRHVWLVRTNPVHVAHWGAFMTTPKVSKDQATLNLQVSLDNQAKTEATVEVSTTIYQLKVDGKTKSHQVAQMSAASTKISGNSNAMVSQQATVKNPALWDLENPHLYCAVTTITKKGTTCDRYETVFGIRTIEYDPARGFLLNGKLVELNGVCQHHDLGPLGTAVNTRALERQIEILKEMGCNSIRTSHNPPTPELLQLSDRMGMLLQVEAFDCWEIGKKKNDYHRFFKEWHKKDLTNLIRRDRNHPSVIMWSTGNEIREQVMPEKFEVSRRLTAIVKAEDPTRPVTAGASYGKASFNGFEKTVDIQGMNYKPWNYQKFRDTSPDIPFYGSETSSCISSRGEYFFPVLNHQAKGQGGHFQVSSYDLYAPGWAYYPDREFKAQDEVPACAGEYVWTGFDYIGEPIPYNQDKTSLLNFADPKERKKMEDELKRLGKLQIPSRSSYFGIVDLCGFRKDRFYLYQARWMPEKPMVHILPHWNWAERHGKVTPVHAYTSGDEVELFLNGKSLGRKKKGQYEYRIRWDDVIYQPGELKAIAYKNGKHWSEKTITTTGKATQLLLTADRSTITADGYDLSFVTATIADDQGLLVPRTHNPLKFTIEGPGEIIATGNGDATNHTVFSSKERKAFNGLCLVIIRSKSGEKGTITLTAVSEKLKNAETKIISQ